MRRILGCLALVAIVVVAAAGFLVWRGKVLLETPYRGWDGESATLVVPPGSTAREILRRLEGEGVIRDADLARIWLRLEGDPPLRAGEYRFDAALTIPEALTILVEGEVVEHEVTIVEGLTMVETAVVLAAAGFGDEDRYLELMGDPEPIADLDPEADTLEGYLHPDSYRFARGTSEATVVRTLVETFRRRWSRRIGPLLSDDGPTVREVVTLASIVEKEAALDEERPIIAGVYRNRLDKGIALYADPTVIYALQRLDRWDGNLRRDDLRVDSPYNTYVHPGLPPGPICSPGLASMEAAADPADVPYLYFVSRNDGSHVFAATLEEHNRNVARWQKRYWRERWAREREDDGS